MNVDEQQKVLQNKSNGRSSTVENKGSVAYKVLERMDYFDSNILYFLTVTSFNSPDDEVGRENLKGQQTLILYILLFYSKKLIISPQLKRAYANPILRPDSTHSWESSAVFNSAAIYLENKVHLVYRAITSTGESVLGYASSEDGINITERSKSPVYFVKDAKVHNHGSYKRLPFYYSSGNSWCGCEDPRLTVIEDRIYMTYTAFSNGSPPFMALTSIFVSDFLAQQWTWKKPLQISPPNQMHKNWVLFPEKVNGQYAILHSLMPAIQIDYLDTLDGDKIIIDSQYHPGYFNHGDWDNWIRGVGPPPIKTKDGWLILYHAMDSRDPNKYKIGAMLLDLVDPTQILCRAPHPLLQPDTIYENQGYKEGVVYACGAVVIDNDLIVYYGAADTVLCAAHINLNLLLAGLKMSARRGSGKPQT
ncbi:TPA: hypothetical protein JAZ38_08655 [Legionella pneumophila]|uniref:Glycosidase n=2 Tax=Legionella pneumophila TaxID=446 RepID=A0AAN5TBE8_LEGPN|nr:hypothetical protein D7274_12045 [Legionella pneumophila]HAT7747159.1 hypothetical protein [Legionella pneumophila]HAT7759691.1 hypothetical protein [Legionella pneumophila]HAT8809438.1 hypothetical protein [Legionella pneumophila]HAU1324566.1 hypothetical protein [Legionella pneumophila]